MPERCPECNLLGGHLPECSRVPPAPKYTPPNGPRSAAYAIAAIAFFYTAPLAVVFWPDWRYQTLGRPIDTLGQVFVGGFIAFVALLWASSVLLLLRRRIGVYLWWLCCPIVLINIPLGTLAGAYVFRQLSTPEAKHDLQ